MRFGSVERMDTQHNSHTTVPVLHQQKYEDLVSTHYYSLSPKAAKVDPGYSQDCN